MSKKAKEKKDKTTQNILIGGAAVGGVLLLTSASPGIFISPEDEYIPTPPFDAEGNDPDETGLMEDAIKALFKDDDGETDRDKIIDLILGIVYIGVSIVAAIRILRNSDDVEDSKIIDSIGTMTDNLALEFDWNARGFYQRNLFTTPGNWGFINGKVQWGANPGGGFKMKSVDTDLNHYFKNEGFNYRSFKNMIEMPSFNFGIENFNLIRPDDGSWNYTQGTNPFMSGGGFFGGIEKKRTKSGIILL